MGSSRKVISLLLAVLLMFLAACSNSSDNKGNDASEGNGEKEETVKIGALMSLSGNFAPLGEGMRKGLDLYLEKQNYKFGNRKVEIIYEDDENNPQIALRKYRKLVDSDKVDMLVGIASSTILYAVRDQVDKGKIPLLVANAGGNDISWDQKSDYIWRSSFSNWQIGAGGASYYANHIGKKVFIIAPDYPAGREQVESFEEAFKNAGGEVMETVWTKVGTTDFASFMPEIAKTKPDVVFTFHTGADAIRFVMQYQEFGFKDKIPLITQASSDVATTPEIKKALEGSYFALMYTLTLDNETNKRFIAEYREKYGKDPQGGYDMQGYDAGQILGKVIQSAKSIDSEEFVKIFKNNLTIDSPRGSLTIDPVTHNPITNVYIQKYIMKDGELTSEDVATVEGVAMPEQKQRK